MPEWELIEDDLAGYTWKFRGEHTLHLFIHHDSKDNNLVFVPRFNLMVEYSEQDLRHLVPDLRSKTRLLYEAGQYGVPLFTAWSPEEFQKEFESRYPLTPLPPKYREIWQKLNLNSKLSSQFQSL